MKHQRVIITTKSGEVRWGYVQLPNDQFGTPMRLQDIINDSRAFLPFFQEREHPRVGEEAEKMTMIHKDTIAEIEER